MVDESRSEMLRRIERHLEDALSRADLLGLHVLAAYVCNALEMTRSVEVARSGDGGEIDGRSAA